MSISTREFLKEYRKKVDQLGGYHEAAAEWGLSVTMVRSVYKAAKLPGKQICKIMNLKPVKEINYRYERV